MFHDLHSHAAESGQIARDTDAVVPDRQDNSVTVVRQTDKHFVCFAMLHRVVCGLLRDAKQVGRSRLVIDEHGIIATEGASHVEELDNRLGQARECLHQAVALGTDRMKPVGEVSRFKDAGAE